jgi:effector-binding domain-containing protein
MSYAYKKIFDHIILKTGECKAHNIPFCIYNQLDWSEMNKTGLFATFKLLFLKDWHLEIGIPTESSVPAFEDMIQTELPAGRFLKTMHIGPYMKVGAAYNRILEYANTNTLELGDFSIERYLNDPKNVAQQELQTEVLVPIKG